MLCLCCYICIIAETSLSGKGEMPIMSAPAAVLFDYGQTLCTEPPADPERGNAAVLAHAVENPHALTPAGLSRLYQQAATELGYDAAEVEISRAAAHLHSQVLQVPWIPLMRLLLESRDVRLDLPWLQVEQLYWDAASPATAAPYLAQTLTQLRARGMGVGVISNLCFTRETLLRRLSLCLPGQAFAFVLTSSAYNFRKPHPALFRLALHKLGLPPEQVWFCGDHPVCDVEGAAGAGLRPIWYRWRGDFDQFTPPACAYTPLTDWRDLPGLLAGA